MNGDLLEAIIRGTPGITLNLTAQDLKEVVTGILHNERKLIAEEVEREKEEYTLTRDEAAKMLRKSRATLIRMAKDGRLVPVKVGMTSLYRQSDIEKYKEENKIV